MGPSRCCTAPRAEPAPPRLQTGTLRGAPTVAFRQGVLHGTDAQHFEMRRIRDERLVAQYDYPHDDGKNAAARRRAPAWVRCVPE
jgi:hypothetical protein